MPFVKVDVDILDSSLWADEIGTRLFLTALCMADLFELRQETPQIAVRALDPAGWTVPPGWYGFIGASSVAILRRATVRFERTEEALDALERLGSPDPDSRSSDFEGRRLVRIEGGWLVLNYVKYRERDYSAAERMRRYRDRRRKRRQAPETPPPAPADPPSPPAPAAAAEPPESRALRRNTPGVTANTAPVTRNPLRKRAVVTHAEADAEKNGRDTRTPLVNPSPIPGGESEGGEDRSVTERYGVTPSPEQPAPTEAKRAVRQRISLDDALAILAADAPELSTGAVRLAVGDWYRHRRERRFPFDEHYWREQVAWLRGLGSIEVAHRALTESYRNRYQALVGPPGVGAFRVKPRPRLRDNDYAVPDGTAQDLGRLFEDPQTEGGHR